MRFIAQTSADFISKPPHLLALSKVVFFYLHVDLQNGSSFTNVKFETTTDIIAGFTLNGTRLSYGNIPIELLIIAAATSKSTANGI